MPPHKYIIKNVLFDDEDEWDTASVKYEPDGRLRRLEERRQQMAERKELVLQSTLDSTRNALRSLREAEDIGISSSRELHHQGTILKNVNVHLDAMGEDLEQSKSHIRSIESVFHSLKKRITGKSVRSRRKRNQESTEEVKRKSFRKSFDDHSTVCVHGLNASSPVDVEKTIGDNLEEMASCLKGLKVIGLNMNQEINSQNHLLDAIASKIDDRDATIKEQTRRIDKLI